MQPPADRSNQQVERPARLATRINGVPLTLEQWRALVDRAGSQSAIADRPPIPLD